MRARFLVFLFLLVCVVSSVTAAEKPTYDFFVPVTLKYADDLGIATGGEWLLPSGVLLAAQVSYDKIDGQHGTTTYNPGHGLTNSKPMPVYYETPDRNVVGLAFTVSIPAHRRK